MTASRIILIPKVASAGGGATGLDDLTDVTITAAASGDILRHNGTAWVDTPGTTHFEVAGAVASHEADTTNVHGIADTSALVTTARTISTTSPLSGGGALSGNLTLSVGAASDTASGVVELATTAEATTGTDTSRAVTPAGVKAVADLKLSLAAAGASVENVGAVEANVNTVAATGATETLDVSLYQVHDCTMDQNCTFTFSNPAPSGKCSSFVLILRGSFTPTLPASVDWSGGVAPTYTTPSVYTFTTVDAGTTWLGAQVGAGFA